jgi:hypothetical protein
MAPSSTTALPLDAPGTDISASDPARRSLMSPMKSQMAGPGPWQLQGGVVHWAKHRLQLYMCIDGYVSHLRLHKCSVTGVKAPRPGGTGLRY